MPKTLKRPRETKLKAYSILADTQKYYVAAANEPQAIGTLMAHLEEDDADKVGPCVEVNPAKVPIYFEKDRGGYTKGSLAEIMPSTDCPEVLIDPDYP